MNYLNHGLLLVLQFCHRDNTRNDQNIQVKKDAVNICPLTLPADSSCRVCFVSWGQEPVHQACKSHDLLSEQKHKT